MRSQGKFQPTTSNNLRSSSIANNELEVTTVAEVEENKENFSPKDRIIIGSIPECLHPDCKGWIVDSFAGKYWIRCEDDKYRYLNSHVNAHTTNDQDQVIAKNRVLMLEERLVNNLTQRVGALNLDLDNNNDTDSSNNNDDDHDYYLDRGMEPPRFAQYRLARTRHKIGDTKTYQDVWDSITQDELDYYLKAPLRVSPEQRYQRIKKEWYFHELSYLHQTVDDDGKAVDIVKEYGCGHWSNKNKNNLCVPECPYYPPYGRIEDE